MIFTIPSVFAKEVQKKTPPLRQEATISLKDRLRCIKDQWHLQLMDAASQNEGRVQRVENKPVNKGLEKIGKKNGSSKKPELHFFGFVRNSKWVVWLGSLWHINTPNHKNSQIFLLRSIWLWVKRKPLGTAGFGLFFLSPIGF